MTNEIFFLCTIVWGTVVVFLDEWLGATLINLEQQTQRTHRSKNTRFFGQVLLYINVY